MMADDTNFKMIAHLDQRFNYLADGDVIAFDARSADSGTYRHASEHNSFPRDRPLQPNFLDVSQPPKEFDNSWIIDEISDAIDLIDPHAKVSASLEANSCSTGGGCFAILAEPGSPG